MERYTIRLLVCAFMLSLIPVLLSAQDKHSEKILIRNVQIFNGLDSQIIRGNVLIEKNKITKISSANVPADKTTKVIDGQMKYLIPGLIDAHTHITFEDINIPLSRVSNETDWATLNLIAVKAAERQLLRGFTTIRNMGGNAIPLAKAIDRGFIIGPRIYPSGAFISQSGGHGDFGFATDVPRISGNLSYSERIGFTAIADGADQVLKATREQLRQGATQIKLMAGGGISSVYDPIDVAQYTVEEFRAAVSAAENWGTYVGVHAYTPRAIQAAIQGGVRSIEHGQLMDEETAKMMAEKGVWLSIQPFVDDGRPMPEGDPIKIAGWKKWKTVVSGTDNAFRLAKKYKVKTAWGTDLFGGIENADKEGFRLALMKRWYSPFEILLMATSGNAELLRQCGLRNPYQEGKLGEISEGAYADLIIVKENPFRNIDIVAEPEKNFLLIMKDGVIYKNVLDRK